MKHFVCIELVVCALLMCIFLATFSAAELEKGLKRRGPHLGLYAFPRVGRSDPSMANNLRNSNEAEEFENLFNAETASLEEYEEYPKSDIKRASLIAFPRVGRSDGELRKWAHLLALQQALEKRNGPSASSGLWFGPRLGKRSVDATEFSESSKGQKELF